MLKQKHHFQYLLQYFGANSGAKGAFTGGAAGMVIANGIADGVKSIAEKPAEMKQNRQARANQKAYEEIYRQMEEKWTKPEKVDEEGKVTKAGRWNGMSNEENLNEHRKILGYTQKEIDTTPFWKGGDGNDGISVP